MKYGWVVLALVVLAHYGYPFISGDPEAASMAFYILRGIEGAGLCVILWIIAPRSVPMTLGCLLGASEETQTAVCGMAGALPVSGWSGLCIEHFGPLPYAATLATVVICARIRHAKHDR